jgi:glycosyltransferase involved in cell wall biosynthesis
LNAAVSAQTLEARTAQRQFSYALVSREVWPFHGAGGIGRYVWATANLLAETAEVTIITSDFSRDEYERLRSAADPRLPEGVRFEFVPEPAPEEWPPFWSLYQCWSARVREVLRELYPQGGPDLLEFPDFTGVGCVTIQARRSGDPALRKTRICVSSHGTDEIYRVLNGYVGQELEVRTILSLERYSLRFADHFLWPGGDVLGTYQRFYGRDRLAPARRVPHAFPLKPPAEALPAAPPPRGGPLKFLYIARLERRKGAEQLVRAATGLERDDWELTLLGGDTATAPLRRSMRAHLERLAWGDPRVRFREPVPHAQVSELIREHDVVVLPALWDCWPNVIREALANNRPVLATPTGGVVEMIQPGHSGWLTRDTSAPALADALETLLDEPEEVERLIASGGPLSALRDSVSNDETLAAYRELAGRGRAERRGRRSRRAPLVSAIVTYCAGDRRLGDTLGSLLGQTHESLEIVVVCDGNERVRHAEQLGHGDSMRVVMQRDAGRGAARNRGIHESRGDYVLIVDAGTKLAASFVARAVAALEGEPELAYATSWAIGPGRGAVPLGNFSALVHEYDLGGTVPLIRRSVLDRGARYELEPVGAEDRLFYSELAAAGLFGAVMPERLVELVEERPAGAPDEFLREELDAHLRSRAVVWEAPPSAGEREGPARPRLHAEVHRPGARPAGAPDRRRHLRRG